MYNLNNKIENGIYTIISLKAESVELQEYFLDVIYSVIQKISEKPKLKEIKIEVDKLINLFSLLTKPPIKTIQGLWAELFLMEQSLCPDYLVKSWHNSVFDKFDFNDGFDKIEVKSTSSNRRIHTFSLEQLNPNVGSSLIIASVFTIETGVGKSIFDLVYNIERKLIEKNLIFRLNEIILYTIGNNFERAFEVYFDYQYAIDTIKYYESSIIPTINKVDVPLEVTKVRFDCELTDLANTTTFKSNSILHKSIYIK